VAPSFLHDQVLYAEALLDLFQATGESDYLRQAVEVSRVMLREFRQDSRKALTDRLATSGDPPELGLPVWDIEDNGRAALMLISLAELSGDESFRREAEEILLDFWPSYEEYSHFAGAYARAVYSLENPPLMMIVVGRQTDLRIVALREEAHRVKVGWKLVEPVDPERDRERLEKSGFPHDMPPAAYICYGSVCSLPVEEPGDLASRVAEFLDHLKEP
jgi:uncharacterized protein YyaL (SSP411 family)